MNSVNDDGKREISVLVIGLGRVAFGYEDIYGDGFLRTHIMAIIELSQLMNLKVHIWGIDPNKDVRNAVNLRYPELILHENLETLPDIEFDLTIISTPTDVLFETVQKVGLQVQSRSVLVEKPGVNSSYEAEELNKLFAKNPNWYLNYPRRSLQSTKFLADRFKKRVPVFIDIKYSGETLNILCHYLDLLEYLFGQICTISRIGNNPEIYFGTLKDNKIYFIAEKTGSDNTNDHQLRFISDSEVINYAECGKRILIDSVESRSVMNFDSELSEMIFHTDFKVMENVLLGTTLNLPRKISSGIMQLLQTR